MTNPRRSRLQPAIGSYTTKFDAYDVNHDAARGRLEFIRRGAGAPGLVSSGRLAAVETFASNRYTTRRYRVTNRGITGSPVDTYVRPATPSGFTVGESLPGGDMAFYRSPARGVLGLRFANGLTGALGSEIQIPQGGAGRAAEYLLDGDHVVTLPAVVAADPVRTAFVTDNTGRSYDTFTAGDNAGTAVAHIASSEGLVAPLANIPFQLTGGTTLARAFNLSVGQPISNQWLPGVAHLPGALRVAVYGSTVEVVDDGPNGLSDKSAGGPPSPLGYRTVRIARTDFVGVLNIQGGSVGLEIHAIAVNRRTYDYIAFLDGDPTRYTNRVAPADSGFHSTGVSFDVARPAAGLSPLALTRTGLFSARTGGGYAWSDGNVVQARTLPFTLNQSTIFGLHGLDALVARASSSGTGYISLDRGASWSTVTFYENQTVGGALAVVNVPPSPLEPLLP
ncbi:hypothetical protein [Methylobacterium indicum]|nr:hypothetical protein [Methylobacterium indicum]